MLTAGVNGVLTWARFIAWAAKIEKRGQSEKLRYFNVEPALPSASLQNTYTAVTSARIRQVIRASARTHSFPLSYPFCALERVWLLIFSCAW